MSQVDRVKVRKAERAGKGYSDSMDIDTNPLSATFLMKVHMQADVQGRTDTQLFIHIPTINEHSGPSMENIKKNPCTSHFVVVGKPLHLSCQLPERWGCCAGPTTTCSITPGLPPCSPSFAIQSSCRDSLQTCTACWESAGCYPEETHWTGLTNRSWHFCKGGTPFAWGSTWGWHYNMYKWGLLQSWCMRRREHRSCQPSIFLLKMRRPNVRAKATCRQTVDQLVSELG